MSITKRIAALIAGCFSLVSAAALAQSGGSDTDQPKAPPGYEAVVAVDKDETLKKLLPTLDWIEISDVVALQRGVIDQMELKIGMPVRKGGTIGTLHRKLAELAVKKNELQAQSQAPIELAEAKREVALSVVARNKRLNDRLPGTVSAEDVAKAEGELKVAQAEKLKAIEDRAIAEAELAISKQTLDEHTIRAPFDGIIIKRMGDPGESVQSSESEAVVTIANIYKLCVDAYVPVEYIGRVRVGQVAEIRPRITKTNFLPVEKKKFLGKVTFIHPEMQAVGERGVRVRAEVDNPDRELMAGMPVLVTIFVPVEATASNNAAGNRTAQNTSDNK